MRIYNPALGRFLSTDPLTKKYPELTPFQFAANTPIVGIDLDGLELQVPTLIEPEPILRTPRPRGGNVDRGISGVEIPEIPIEMESAPRAHSNYDPSKYIWFDANGHPQTNVEPKKTIEPIKDPLARKLQGNLIKTKLEETKNSEEKDYVYRAMGVGADGKPEVAFNPNPSPNEVTGRMLGVRSIDLQQGLLNKDGTVSPGLNKGGMSSSSVPSFVPAINSMIDSGKRTIFKIKKSVLIDAGLSLDQDGATHISIQPGSKMSIEQYQQAILKTKDSWEIK